MLSITKEFTFDAAHRLPTHSGKCSNLHGHTYRVKLELSRKDSKEPINKDGMVIDFNIVKEKFVYIIKEYFDHTIMLHMYDKFVELLANADSHQMLWFTGHPQLSIIPTIERKLIMGTLPSYVGRSSFLLSSCVIFKTTQPPTAEALSIIINELLQQYMFQHTELQVLQVNSITVYETPDSFATFIPTIGDKL